MGKTNDRNMFHGDPEQAVQAVAMASRVLLEMACSVEAEHACCDDKDPDNMGATYAMLGAMLFDAHAVLLDAGACELGTVKTE